MPSSGSARKRSAGTASAVSVEDRKAKLERVVHARSRDGRAVVRERGDFSALLVRGAPVDHRRHFIGAIAAAAIGGLGGRALFDVRTGLLLVLLAGGGYALFWLFLAVTGGEELDRLEVDEQGLVHSEITGRSPEYRPDFLKVAVPVAVIAYSLYLVVGLGRDLVFPPHPNCNTSPPPAGACLLLPNLSDALGGLAASPSHGPATVSPEASPGSTTSPGATASPPAAGKTVGKPLTLDQAIALERIVRGFQLFFASVALVAAAWFLNRMLNGRGVLLVDPVRRRGKTE